MGGERFSYRRHGNGIIRIFWQGRCVMTLGGERGERLAADLEAASPQAEQDLLRRVTGNFKRGNERKPRQRR